MTVFRPLKTGVKCSCGALAQRLGWEKCSCPREAHYVVKFTWKGRQVMRKTEITDKAEARRRANSIAAGFKAGEGERVMALLDSIAHRRVLASIGELVDLWVRNWRRVKSVEKQAMRCVSDLYRVLAWALDLWTKHEGGRRGVKIGDKTPDVERIRALSTSVLCGASVRKYFDARVADRDGVRLAGSAAPPVQANFLERREENRSINSTLRHVHEMLAPMAQRHVYEGALKLPDLRGFLEFDFLREVTVEPEPIPLVQYAQMVAAADTLWAAGAELGLVNWIFRETGMRSGSVKYLKSTWLHRMSDGWWLHVGEKGEGDGRKRGTRRYSVPITDELAAVIGEREGFTICNTGSERERHELVEQRHNAWLAEFIGGAGQRGQKNHRMRDTVLSIVRTLHGLVAAQEMGGHSDSKTTLKFYAQLRYDVSERMRRDLRAASRLVPGNVVTMAQAAAPVAGELVAPAAPAAQA